MDELLDFNKSEVESKRDFPLATTGQRFTNYIIDSIALIIGIVILSAMFGVLLVVLGNEEVLQEVPEETSKITDYVIGAIAMTIYFVISEFFFKGKSLGKIITKTRAVTASGEIMNFNQTLIRSLCRSIPFDAFSFLAGGQPVGWHDSISNTKVVSEKDA